MAQVLAQSFYLGPFAVYTSPSGMTDPITGLPELGGTLHEGDYVDLTESEAQQWSIRFGSQLHQGRYRFVRLSTASTAANIAFGKPVGWALGQSVAQVVLSAAGSGATTDGTYTITSTTSGGTAAVALATVSGGAITAVQLTYAGANFTAVPTFGLTEIAGLTGGSVLAQVAESANVVGSFDTTASTALSTPRGIALCAPTTAQIAANAWIVIQELGVAQVLVTTATSATRGNTAWAGAAGAVTTNVPTSWYEGTLGQTLDLSAANTTVRVALSLPVLQG